jgi:hypothetical protein
MSTKIYNGFRIDTTSLHTVMRVVETFRPFILTEGEKLMDKFFAKQDESVAWGTWIRCQREIKTTGCRIPACDTEFKLTIFPSHQSYMYGIAYTEHDDWFDAFCEQPLIREFGYWNNSDRRDGISIAEWNQRRDVWNDVIGERIPAMHGFAIDVHDPNGPMPKTLRTFAATEHKSAIL